MGDHYDKSREGQMYKCDGKLSSAEWKITGFLFANPKGNGKGRTFSFPILRV